MLIYGVSGIFAHKKTIKQFLQPMIEQVWGGGGGCAGRMCCFFASVFQSYCIFVSVFSIHQCLFRVHFTNISIFLLYVMCISSKSQKVFWAQNFRDAQLIPNFLRYPACLWYCSFWKASLAKNCLIDGFSYSNNIFKTFLWRKLLYEVRLQYVSIYTWY